MLNQYENYNIDSDRHDENPLPTVSIMISVYNQMHCLTKALDSALAQDYPHLEVVIGDDCSTDGEVGDQVARWKDPRIRYFRNEKNLGMNENYRQLLRHYAVGDLAIMLNADDYFTDPHFISEAATIFMENEGVALTFGDVKVFVEATGDFFEDTVNRDLPPLIEGDQLFLDYPKGYSFPHLTCLYDRRHALDIGFYTGNEISADWGSLLALIQGKKVGYINRTVGVLCRHRENVCKTKHGEKLFDGDVFIHRVYDSAVRQGTFSEEILTTWRKRMLRRHHAKCLIKIWFLDKTQLRPYQDMLRTKYPKIYRSIMLDFRYWFFCFIRNNSWLLRLTFKYVLKQESFILDLIAHRDETTG